MSDTKVTAIFGPAAFFWAKQTTLRPTENQTVKITKLVTARSDFGSNSWPRANVERRLLTKAAVGYIARERRECPTNRRSRPLLAVQLANLRRQQRKVCFFDQRTLPSL